MKIMTAEGPTQVDRFGAAFAGVGGGYHNYTSPQEYSNQHHRGNFSGSPAGMYDMTPSTDVQMRVQPQGGYTLQGGYPAGHHGHCRFSSLLLQLPMYGYSQNVERLCSDSAAIPTLYLLDLARLIPSSNVKFRWPSTPALDHSAE